MGRGWVRFCLGIESPCHGHLKRNFINSETLNLGFQGLGEAGASFATARLGLRLCLADFNNTVNHFRSLALKAALKATRTQFVTALRAGTTSRQRRAQVFHKILRLARPSASDLTHMTELGGRSRTRVFPIWSITSCEVMEGVAGKGAWNPANEEKVLVDSGSLIYATSKKSAAAKRAKHPLPSRSQKAKTTLPIFGVRALQDAMYIGVSRIWQPWNAAKALSNKPQQ